MGRPRLYQRTDVLKKAYETFWAKGYQATTVQDLLDTMDMNRGSLYAGFTDKRSLFVESLRFYQQDVVQRLFTESLRPDSARDTIRTFLDTIVQHSLTDREKPGCLLTNTVTELSTLDPGMQEDLRGALKLLENFFAEQVRRGVESGEFPPGLDVEYASRFLLAVLEGVNVLGKIQPDAALLQNVVAAGMRVLDTATLASAAD